MIRFNIILLVLFILYGCIERTDKIKSKNKVLLSISFSNHCDSIEEVDIILNDEQFDSTTIELASLCYFNCNEYRKTIYTLQHYSKKIKVKLSEHQNLRLCEAYRKLNLTDSAMYYLDIFEKQNMQTHWDQGKFALWRMQISFEGNRFKEAIKYAELAIQLGYDSTSFREEWPHEYIAQSYFLLDSLNKFCAYSKKHAPRVYMKSVCGDN